MEARSRRKEVSDRKQQIRVKVEAGGNSESHFKAASKRQKVGVENQKPGTRERKEKVTSVRWQTN